MKHKKRIILLTFLFKYVIISFRRKIGGVTWNLVKLKYQYNYAMAENYL